MKLRYLPLLLFSACAPVSTVQTSTAPTPTAPTLQAPTDAYARVARRIEPIAEQVCRQKNPRASRISCDFLITVDTRQAQQPNAYQTLNDQGRPIILFNLPMLRTIRNDDEMAFIMGHEAGHQIRRHIAEAQRNAGLGAVIFGTLTAALGGSDIAVTEAQRLGGAVGARAYSQDHELEADTVGTYIAYLAGYDPLVGAQSFARFGGSDSILSTHPPGARRLATVQRTVAQINQVRANGQPVVVP